MLIVCTRIWVKMTGYSNIGKLSLL